MKMVPLWSIWENVGSDKIFYCRQKVWKFMCCVSYSVIREFGFVLMSLKNLFSDEYLLKKWYVACSIELTFLGDDLLLFSVFKFLSFKADRSLWEGIEAFSSELRAVDFSLVLSEIPSSESSESELLTVSFIRPSKGSYLRRVLDIAFCWSSI